MSIQVDYSRGGRGSLIRRVEGFLDTHYHKVVYRRFIHIMEMYMKGQSSIPFDEWKRNDLRQLASAYCKMATKEISNKLFPNLLLTIRDTSYGSRRFKVYEGGAQHFEKFWLLMRATVDDMEYDSTMDSNKRRLNELIDKGHDMAVMELPKTDLQFEARTLLPIYLVIKEEEKRQEEFFMPVMEAIAHYLFEVESKREARAKKLANSAEHAIETYRKEKKRRLESPPEQVEQLMRHLGGPPFRPPRPVVNNALPYRARLGAERYEGDAVIIIQNVVRFKPEWSVQLPELESIKRRRFLDIPQDEASISNDPIEEFTDTDNDDDL